MGATNFARLTYGKNPEDAIDNAKRQAELEMDADEESAYSGDVNAKHYGHKVFPVYKSRKNSKLSAWEVAYKILNQEIDKIIDENNCVIDRLADNSVGGTDGPIGIFEVTGFQAKQYKASVFPKRAPNGTKVYMVFGMARS